MFFDNEKRERLDKQILKAEEISVQEQAEKMEKKNRDNLNLVAEGLVSAGKIVKEMQEKQKGAEAKEITAMRETGHLGRRDESMRRRREQSTFESRRRMKLGVLLERYFPEVKDRSLDEVEMKMKAVANEGSNQNIIKNISETQ